MKTRTHSRAVAAALAILVLTTPFASAASNDTLLKMIPADTLFCLRINALNPSLTKLDQYLAGASPLPLSLKVLANMQLAGLVGDPMLTGLDTDGTFTVIALASDTGIEMALLAPMTSYEEFTKNPACSPSTTPQITLLAAPGSPLGTLALMPLPGTPYALISTENEQTTLPANARKQTAPGTALAARLDADQAAQAVSAPAWLYVNLARINDLYGPMLLMMIDGLQQQMPPQAAMEGAMDINFKMLTGMVTTVLGQADALTLALSPEPSVLNMDTAFSAKKGSDLAAMLIADPKNRADFTLAGLADNTAAFNAVFKTNDAVNKQLFALFSDFMQTLVGDKLTPDQIQQTQSFMNKAFDLSGTETFVAFTYGPGQPPFSMRQVQHTNNPTAFKALMQDSIPFVNNIYEAMSMPIVFSHEPRIETYRNVTIDAFKIQFNFDQDAPERTAIEMMYGPDGLTYYTAQKGSLFLTAFGPDGKNNIKALIDAPANRPPAGELKMALANLGPNAQKADMVGSLNILKLVKGGLAIPQQMAGPAETQILSAIAAALNTQTQSCMALSAAIADGRITTRMALPKQHLIEIIAAAMQIQMQIMLQAEDTMPGMMGGMTPQPQSAAPAVDPMQEWVGKPAPDLKIKDLQGNAFSIADLKGKKIVLDFWATWCPPCKEMIPDLIKLRNGTPDAQLAILGLSSEPADRIAKFAADQKINYPVISHAAAMPDPYGKVTFLPTTFLIDTAGVIRHVLIGYHSFPDLQAALNAMQ